MYERLEICGEFAIIATKPIVLRTAGLDDDRVLYPGEIEYIDRNTIFEVGLAGDC